MHCFSLPTATRRHIGSSYAAAGTHTLPPPWPFPVWWAPRGALVFSAPPPSITTPSNLTLVHHSFPGLCKSIHPCFCHSRCPVRTCARAHAHHTAAAAWVYDAGGVLCVIPLYPDELLRPCCPGPVPCRPGTRPRQIPRERGGRGVPSYVYPLQMAFRPSCVDLQYFKTSEIAVQRPADSAPLLSSATLLSPPHTPLTAGFEPTATLRTSCRVHPVPHRCQHRTPPPNPSGKAISRAQGKARSCGPVPLAPVPSSRRGGNH